MATAEELYKKVSRNSHYQPTQPNRSRTKPKPKPKPTLPSQLPPQTRTRSYSGGKHSNYLATSKLEPPKPNKKSKSKAKDTHSLTRAATHSLSKPFRYVGKKLRAKDEYANHHSNHSNYKKTKTKMKSKHKSIDNSQKIYLKKVINRELIKQYQQYVEKRVDMLKSKSFPNELLNELPQYRAELTNRWAKYRPKPMYSRHTEKDYLIQQDLKKAEKAAIENVTKLHNKKSTFRAIKHNIAAPLMMPINTVKSVFGHSVDNKKQINIINNTVTHLSNKDFENGKVDATAADNQNDNDNEGVTDTNNSTIQVLKLKTSTNLPTFSILAAPPTPRVPIERTQKNKKGNKIKNNDNDDDNDTTKDITLPDNDFYSTNSFEINDIASPNANLCSKFNIPMDRHVSASVLDNDDDIPKDKDKATGSPSPSPSSKDGITRDISISPMNDHDAELLISNLSPNHKHKSLDDDNGGNNDPPPHNIRHSSISSVNSIGLSTGTGTGSTSIDILDVNYEQTPILTHSATTGQLNDDTLLLNRISDTFRRAKTVPNKLNKNDFTSPSPPSITRADRIDSSLFIQKYPLRSHTPSWALHENTEDDDDNDNDNDDNDIKQHHIVKSNASVIYHSDNDHETPLSQINEDNKLDELQKTVNLLKKQFNEQNNTINELKKEINEIKLKYNSGIGLGLGDINNNKLIIKISEEKDSKKDSSMRNVMSNVMPLMHRGWNKIKKGIFEDQDIISFERSTFENIYHSLFCYFMNGLMVIFTLFMKIWMIFAYMLHFMKNCICKRNNKTNQQIIQNDISPVSSNLPHSNQPRSQHSRRRKGRRRRQNNDNLYSDQLSDDAFQ